MAVFSKAPTLMASVLAMSLALTACTHHETGEAKKTEEVAAQLGEIARAKNPEPQSKEQASPAASFAAQPAAAASAAPTTTAAASGNAGEALFNSVCKTCHEGGLMGAPKFGDKASWAPRIAQGKDILYKHSIEGFQGKNGVMPPKGGSTASDADVKAAVDYMVSKAS